MFEQMIFPGFGAPTSSPASQDGPKPSASPTGPTMCPSGPEARPASRSAPQDSAGAATTPGTSVPSLSIWSGLAAPLCCSESRSPARMLSDALQSRVNEALERTLHGRGATIYSYAWKRQVTPHGRALFLLRASAHRTSGSGCSSAPSICDLPQVGWNTSRATDGSNGGPGQTGGALPADAALAGWATASARDWKDSAGMATEAVNPDGSARSRLDQLGRQVFLAGWPTAMAGTPAQNGNNAAGNTDSSRKTMALAGWPTAVANDDNKTPEAHLAMKRRMGERDGSGAERTAITSLQVMVQTVGPARLTASGEMLTGSSAGMSGGGQLSPAFSLWLMGFPAAWGCCGARAMRSSRKRPPRSSTPAGKP